MLNNENVFELSRETRRLSKLEGNCGRTIRRFLTRLLADHPRMLHQIFASMETLSPEDFRAKGEFAHHVLRNNQEDLGNTPYLKEIGVVVDEGFGIVQNSYNVTVDIATASVSDLKGLLLDIAILSDNMHSYAANPEQAVNAVVNREALEAAAREERERQQNEWLCKRLGFLNDTTAV